MGPQSLGAGPEMIAWARVAPVVKSGVNPELLRHADQADVLIFRPYFANQNLDDPAGAVAEAVRLLNGFRDPRLAVELYVGIGSSATAAHIRFMAGWTNADGTVEPGAVKRLAAAGLRAAGPGWYTGDYDATTFAAWRQARWAGISVLTLQAYWTRQVGLTPWNAWRWKPLWNPALGDPSTLVIDECGEDRVRDGDPHVDDGYVGQPGYLANGTPPDVFIEELVTFAEGLPAGAYATPYVGDPTADWASFDLNPIAARLVTRLASRAPAGRPQSIPIPIPGGKPVATNPPPAPKFSVGPGVAAKLAEKGDVPTSDEQYLGSEMSFTTGHKGIYIYSRGGNETLFIPKA